MNVALYPRVSTQEQALNGHSIDEQIERMTKYCESMGWDVYNVYTDAGFSGGNTNRPALQRMIKDIKRGKIDKVLVYKLDRLSRSQKDTLVLIEDEFLANGCDFVSMSENFNTSTAFGKAMLGILAVFAELEKSQIKERMAIGRDGRAKKGKFHGGSVIPIGYDYTDGKLVVNEFEAMQVKKIFEMYLAGKSAYKIADYLNESGYVHRYGNWTQATIMDCLKKQVYLGNIVHNGNVYDGEHEAIIDQVTFDKANAMKQHRSEEHAKKCIRRGKVTSYLGGYIYCAHCGSKYSKMKRNCRGYIYNKYVCYSRWKVAPRLVKDPNCMNKIWNMTDLDNIVFDEIKKLSLDSDYFEEIISNDDSQKEIIQNEIKKLDEQIERVMDLYTLGQFPIDILQKKVQTLNDQKESLEDELHKLTDEEQQRMSKEKTMEIISSFSDVLEKGDFDEIRTVIGALIDRVEIDNEDITIKWNFA